MYFISLIIMNPRCPKLFPYTTLFRSRKTFSSMVDRGDKPLNLLQPFINLPVSVNPRSEEHTSELQSRGHLVCRLLLDIIKCLCKKKTHYLKRDVNRVQE